MFSGTLQLTTSSIRGEPTDDTPGKHATPHYTAPLQSDLISGAKQQLRRVLSEDAAHEIARALVNWRNEAAVRPLRFFSVPDDQQTIVLAQNTAARVQAVLSRDAQASPLRAARTALAEVLGARSLDPKFNAQLEKAAASVEGAREFFPSLQLNADGDVEELLAASSIDIIDRFLPKVFLEDRKDSEKLIYDGPERQSVLGLESPPDATHHKDFIRCGQTPIMFERPLPCSTWPGVGAAFHRELVSEAPFLTNRVFWLKALKQSVTLSLEMDFFQIHGALQECVWGTPRADQRSIIDAVVRLVVGHNVLNIALALRAHLTAEIERMGNSEALLRDFVATKLEASIQALRSEAQKHRDQLLSYGALLCLAEDVLRVKNIVDASCETFHLDHDGRPYPFREGLAVVGVHVRGRSVVQEWKGVEVPYHFGEVRFARENLVVPDRCTEKIYDTLTRAFDVGAVSLVCGPPGSGKTELGKDLVVQLGYAPVVIDCKLYSESYETREAALLDFQSTISALLKLSGYAVFFDAAQYLGEIDGMFDPNFLQSMIHVLKDSYEAHQTCSSTVQKRFFGMTFDTVSCAMRWWKLLNAYIIKHPSLLLAPVSRSFTR